MEARIKSAIEGKVVTKIGKAAEAYYANENLRIVYNNNLMTLFKIKGSDIQTLRPDIFF